MTTQSDPFLRFVQGNLTMKCPTCGAGRRGIEQAVTAACAVCHSTGRVPRPEAVELWEALTEAHFHIHQYFNTQKPCACGAVWAEQLSQWSGGITREPHSPAEQHVALEEWLGSQGFGYENRPNALGNLTWRMGEQHLSVWKYVGLTLQEVTEAALVASGWTVLEKAMK